MGFTNQPTGPFSAIGKVTAAGPRTKAKKAGGTYTINVATLDSGVEVDFGFKPVSVAVGTDVSWEVKKEYGSYKFVGDNPNAGQFQPAFPPRTVAPYSTPSPNNGPAFTPVVRPPSPYYAKPFPLPREHGDTAIIRQNALTNAVNTHDLLTEFGGTKKELSIEALSDSIIKLAYKYASFSSGQMDEAIAADIASRASEKAA